MWRFSASTLFGLFVAFLSVHVTRSASAFEADLHAEENKHDTSTRRHRVTSFTPANNHAMLQDAIMTIQHAFEPQKSDFMERLSTANKESRLAYFISDENELSSIEQDLFNFRKTLEQQQQQQQQQGVYHGDDMDEMSSIKSLPLLKSAIEKLHLAFMDLNDVPVSQTMMEETIMDLAAAVEQGGNDDDEEMEAFIASHSSIIANALKSSIALLHERLMVLHDDNPTEMISMPGTASKEYTIMGDCPINATEAVGGLYKDFESKVLALGDAFEAICYLSIILNTILLLIFPWIIPVLLYIAIKNGVCDSLKICLELLLNALFNPKCWLESFESCNYE